MINIRAKKAIAIAPSDSGATDADGALIDSNGDGHRVFGVDRSPKFADPDRPIDTSWQGTARAAFPLTNGHTGPSATPSKRLSGDRKLIERPSFVC